VPIPYSGSRYAFYIPILLSIGISIIISWYFMKKKWF
jgi:magnesium transporter